MVADPDLLSKARDFLRSPAIQQQDVPSKLKFLIDKGLSADEAASLIREIRPIIPAIPPRTYPQPPPSQLPRLLAGIARVFAWITGTGGFIALIYQRLFLPRILATLAARRALLQHQRSLLDKLADRIEPIEGAVQVDVSTAPAMTTLLDAIPKGGQQGPYQHTMHSLSELTGYISSQVYVPYRTSSATSSGPAEDLKKEIRALKGLVLNRRSFLPPRPLAGNTGSS